MRVIVLTYLVFEIYLAVYILNTGAVPHLGGMYDALDVLAAKD